MRRKSCQRKWRRELFARQLKPRKDQKEHSEIFEGTRIPTFQACHGKPRVICRRGTLTQFHQSRNWPDHFIARKFINKRNKKIHTYIYVDLDHFQIIQQLAQCISRATRTIHYVVSSSVLMHEMKWYVVLQSGPLFALIEEADQNPQIICRDDLQGLYWSYTIGKGIKRLGKSVSQRRMPRETEKPPLMEQVPARKIKTDME